jgi:hypothetical protein
MSAATYPTFTGQLFSNPNQEIRSLQAQVANLRNLVRELQDQRDIAVTALTSISDHVLEQDEFFYSNRACIKTAKKALKDIEKIDERL